MTQEENPEERIPRIVSQPRPLDSCPGVAFWRPFFGKPYLVFVDESFRGFFEFDRRGYFVHAAVGIPEAAYESLKADVAPLFEDFKRLTSAGAKEFKHSEFKRIEYRERRKLAFKLRDILKAHGVFIAGFYSPVESFVLERVRRNLFLEDRDALPDDCDKLYERAEKELRGETEGPGQSGLIGELLELPVTGVANMLAGFSCKFTVIYDPRQSKEDKAVAATIDAYLSLMENLKGSVADLRSDLKEFVLGFVYDRRSEDDLGLQLADLVAGEIRDFFVSNPELLEYEASRVLITPTSYEPVVTALEVKGELFKTGAFHPMTSALKRRFFRQDPEGKTILPILRELFASGLLTCYSVFGQPRDLMIFEGAIWDQVE